MYLSYFQNFQYEANERKRQAERQRAVEVISGARGLRREVWTRPGGRRTTTLLQADRLAARAALSDDEELSSMTSIEVNIKFPFGIPQGVCVLIFFDVSAQQEICY